MLMVEDRRRVKRVGRGKEKLGRRYTGKGGRTWEAADSEGIFDGEACSDQGALNELLRPSRRRAAGLSD